MNKKNQIKSFIQKYSKFQIPNLSTKGFTLVEILVVTGIFVLLMGMSLFMSFDYYRGYLLGTERDITVGVLEKARSRALSNMFESSHGVHIDSDNYILFRGDVYVVGAPTNENIPANSAIQKSGLSNIIFSQLTGLPNVAGDITLTDGAKSKIISINNESRIEW